MIVYAFKGVPMHINLYWLFIPLIVIVMAGIGLGLGIIISSLTTKYRDLVLLLTFAVQLGMYITPIAYPLSFLQGTDYKWLINLNPLTPITEAFRYCLFGKATVQASGLLYSIVFMILVLFAGALFFNKVEKNFMDTV
jgi:lipopolysaccharide transport system permease protein